MKNQNFINLRQRRNFGEVLNISAQFIRQYWSFLLYYFAYLVAPYALVSGIAYGILMNKMAYKGSDTFFSFFGVIGQGIDESENIISMICWTLGQIALVGMILNFLALYESGNRYPSVWQLGRELKRNALKIGIGAIITIFIYLLVILAFFTAIAFLGTPILMVFGFFIAFAGSAYLSAPICMYFVVMVIERRNFADALLRVNHIFANHSYWLNTFLIILIAFIIQSGAGFLMKIPVMLAGIFSEMTSTIAFQEQWYLPYVNLLASIISTLGSSLTSIMIWFPIGIQYFSIIEDKEAIGLLNRIQTIGNKFAIEDDEEDF